MWDSDSEPDDDIFAETKEQDLSIPQIYGENTPVIIPFQQTTSDTVEPVISEITQVALAPTDSTRPENLSVPLPSRKRKSYKTTPKKDRSKSKVPRMVVELDDGTMKPPFQAATVSPANSFIPNLAEKSLVPLTRAYTYNPFFNPDPWLRFTPMLQPISTIIAATDSRMKLPIGGAPTISNKPILPTVIGQLLPTKPVEQTLPLPPLNLDALSQNYNSADKLPPLNYSRT